MNEFRSKRNHVAKLCSIPNRMTIIIYTKICNRMLICSMFDNTQHTTYMHTFGFRSKFSHNFYQTLSTKTYHRGYLKTKMFPWFYLIFKSRPFSLFINILSNRKKKKKKKNHYFIKKCGTKFKKPHIET